jgi:hypothetical protein
METAGDKEGPDAYDERKSVPTRSFISGTSAVPGRYSEFYDTTCLLSRFFSNGKVGLAGQAPIDFNEIRAGFLHLSNRLPRFVFIANANDAGIKRFGSVNGSTGDSLPRAEKQAFKSRRP